MTKRSPLAVFLLSIITCGIYAWYWIIKTKGELNARGASIPTAWIWLIPVVGTIFWLWKYCQGVAIVTKGQSSAAVTFIATIFLSVIWYAVLQSTYNKVA